MLNQEALQRVLSSAGLSAPVRWDDVTGSTNATASTMAEQGAPAWTLIAAGHQTSGRGRQGRAWLDSPGGALMFSVVLRPAWEPDRVGLVSLAAGATMAEAASLVSGEDVRCKWPNDLMVGEAKVGGVLGEARISGRRIELVVVGIGLNLDAPEGVDGADGIGDVDEEELLGTFIRGFRSLLEGTPAGILHHWRERSATLGRRVEATTAGGDTARGIAADVDDRGGLIVLTDEGPATVAFDEIRHLDVNQG